MMFIRSLADFNRAPWAVKLVTVGAITVTAQAHSSPTRHDEPAKKWGLLNGHQWGLPTGHHWGLFHGHGQLSATPRRRHDASLAGLQSSDVVHASGRSSTTKLLR